MTEDEIFGAFGNKVSERIKAVIAASNSAVSDKEFVQKERLLMAKVASARNPNDILLYGKEINELVSAGLIKSKHVFAAFLTHQLSEMMGKAGVKVIDDQSKKIDDLEGLVDSKMKEVKKLKAEIKRKDDLMVELAQDRINLKTK